MKTANLCVCKGFLPTKMTDDLNCYFYFVDTKNIDPISLLEVSRAYGHIYIENQVYEICKDAIKEIEGKLTVIKNFVSDFGMVRGDMKIAFLASSDTHVQFMQKIAKYFDSYLYVIPALKCKDDAAADALKNENENYIELDYRADKCKELIDFNPQYVFCAADWTSEFWALQRVIKETSIRCIALQEGPQDWHFKIWNGSQLKILNHYRNADIVFATGGKTYNYIRPKYFAVTGNPKMPIFEMHPLPKKPKVFINCNFTYLKTKPAYESKRELWMNSVLRVCKRLGLDYIISRHPRDDSKWDGEPVISSNAYIIKEQLLSCSICISRFSSVLYEAAAYGRKSIYYNIGMEPMGTFQDETAPYIPCIVDEYELEDILKDHVSKYPVHIDEKAAANYLTRHVAKLDGKAEERIVNLMKDICIDTPESFMELETGVGRRVTAEKIDTNSMLDENRNTLIVLKNDDSEEYYQGLRMAEKLAEKNTNVFVAIDELPKESEGYLQNEMHQSIEFIPTSNYSFDLCGVSVGRIFFASSIRQNKMEFENVLKSDKCQKPVIVSICDDNPEISIIVPFYNTEKYLYDCIDSIANQTFSDIEIILVNDGSEDNSLSIACQLRDADSRISIIDIPHGGLSYARNKGLTRAKGKYVLFVDSDDYLERNALETLKNSAEGIYDMVLFGANCICEDRESPVYRDEMNKGIWDRFVLETTCGIDAFLAMRKRNKFMSSIPVQMFRRELLVDRSILFTEGYIHEDFAFSFASIINAQNVLVIEDKIYNRRVRAGSTVTTSLAADNVKGRFAAYMDVVECFPSVRYECKEALFSYADMMKNNVVNFYRKLTDEERVKVKFGHDLRRQYMYNEFYNRYLKKYDNESQNENRYENSADFAKDKAHERLKNAIRNFIKKL